MKKTAFFIFILMTVLSISTVFAAEQSDVSNVVDFVVNVKEGRDAKVLQLTDPQVIESEQQRYSGRLGDIEYDRWRRARREEECKKYIRQVVRSYNPDLIIITGDIVYGEFDDTGEVLLDFIGFMDSFEIHGHRYLEIMITKVLKVQTGNVSNWRIVNIVCFGKENSPETEITPWELCKAGNCKEYFS